MGIWRQRPPLLHRPSGAQGQGSVRCPVAQQHPGLATGDKVVGDPRGEGPKGRQAWAAVECPPVAAEESGAFEERGVEADEVEALASKGCEEVSLDDVLEAVGSGRGTGPWVEVGRGDPCTGSVGQNANNACATAKIEQPEPWLVCDGGRHPWGPRGAGPEAHRIEHTRGNGKQVRSHADRGGPVPAHDGCERGDHPEALADSARAFHGGVVG